MNIKKLTRRLKAIAYKLIETERAPPHPLACPVCGYLNGYHRDLTCPGLTDIGDMLKMANLYKESYVAQRTAVTKLRATLNDRVNMWKGKFNELRHENNELRKQIRKRDQKANTSGDPSWISDGK
mgnify:CR=1 FL=1